MLRQQTTLVEGNIVTPVNQTLHFKTQTEVPRVGVMLVGLGGNNGSTVAAGILANKNSLTWSTKASYVIYIGRTLLCCLLLAFFADVVYCDGCFVTSSAVRRGFVTLFLRRWCCCVAVLVGVALFRHAVL